MPRLISTTFVTILLASPAIEAAPTELAWIPISLTVQESCVIQAGDAAITAANQPAVSCLHGAPFQIVQVGFEPAMPADTAQNPPSMQFVATRDAQPAIWMINF
ncbi:hypothetical protein [Paraburkholderia sp. BL23I1N1]|uniref:hypothetical protein n=1 Tax=Paraburkholderia sp. BL23I1N1 TaxID=1938802 RepID=UPI0011C359B7|nr:hypothetical protein [Paraburkholderia sp. BL23I1N1]